MYKLLEILLTPFLYLYVFAFNTRAKLFGYDIKYNYLPKEISTSFLPVIMDWFWLKRGFFGRNKCLVPKGRPFSDRFNDKSPYFQTWVGTYAVTSLQAKRFKSEFNKLWFLASAAVEDQDAWLSTYGVENPNCRLIRETVQKVAERDAVGFKQSIYYGEIESDVDDSQYTKTDLKLLHLLAAKLSAIYNNKKVDSQLLMRDGIPYQSSRVMLFGYYSIIQLSARKYLVTYVCGTKEHKHLINAELLKIMNNVEVVKA